MRFAHESLLPRSLAVGALVVFAALGMAIRLPHEPAVTVGAAGAAVVAGGPLLLRGADRLLAASLLTVTTAAVAALTGGTSSNGWFALCVLMVWSVLTAHSLTVSLLHISSARLAVEHDPDDAARALGEAERLGRESLDEVRSIVGLMRSTGGEAPGALAPVRGLDGLPELVERFRGAGADVTLARHGEMARVPATAGATLYRIAQEALTNATKHAPGARWRLRWLRREAASS